jgi:hypothetical protein
MRLLCWQADGEEEEDEEMEDGLLLPPEAPVLTLSQIRKEAR